jgi:hypothetical protein
MKNPTEMLKKHIKMEVQKLICEAHPLVCELRDQNYERLEGLILNELLSDKHTEPISIQTAIANLEMEL